MKCAIFGGTFDPIHNGHLFIASESASILSLNKIFFVVANIPPHKELKSNVSSLDRLIMTKLAIKNNPLFEVIDYEIKKGGISYTIDTVDYIYNNYNITDKINIIIGADLVYELDKWHDFEKLREKVNFIVYNRNNDSGKNYLNKYSFLKIVDSLEINISSTIIRKRIKENKNIRYLVSEEVYFYIKEKKLYL